MANTVQIYDTTLRDGAQREGISFSLTDKLAVARKLDELGVRWIEGGFPGSNPKDAEFFARAVKMQFRNATLVAFGSTRKPGGKTASDPNLKVLVDSGVSAVCIVAKAWDAQVTRVLETTLDENLAMIKDSVSFLKSKGMTVFLDAEHFFDGYSANPEYSLKCLEVGLHAGADCLVLCDTNGGSLPDEVAGVITEVMSALPGAEIGIHAHNDAEVAVANSLAAVDAGAVQIQGTINGYGERCGNANLCSVIPALKLKMEIDCVSDKQLANLTDIAHAVAEIANSRIYPFLPYIGASAFTHKGGMHVAAIRKWQDAYQHVDPARVGNQPKVVVSELSGKSNILHVAGQQDVKLDGKQAARLLEHVKDMESRGFQYDNAEASLELLLTRAAPDYQAPFTLVDFMVVVESMRRAPTRRSQVDALSEAMLKVKVGKEQMHTAAEGNGPVNALDAALRKALLPFYPRISEIKLVDYKVRILEGGTGTGSQVRVLIESADASENWRTVGGSSNIIEASYIALADSLEWWLTKHDVKPVSKVKSGKKK